MFKSGGLPRDLVLPIYQAPTRRVGILEDKVYKTRERSRTFPLHRFQKLGSHFVRGGLVLGYGQP